MNPRSSRAIAAMVSALLLIMGLAAPAHAVARLGIQSAATYFYQQLFAASTTFAGDEAFNDTVYTYQWYLCEGDTDFMSTRLDGSGVSAGDVTEAAVETELSENGCVPVAGQDDVEANYTHFYESGSLGYDPKDNFATFTIRMTYATVAYPVYAVADGGRLIDLTAMPTAAKSGSNFVGTAAAVTARSEESESRSIVAPYSGWWYCDSAIDSGVLLMEPGISNGSDSLIPGCKELIADFYDDEGISAHFATDPTINPADSFYDTWPEALGQEVPVNLDGKYLIWVTNAYPYLSWSGGLKVGEEEVQPVSFSKAVFFAPLSSKLDAKAMRSLKGLATRIKALGSVTSIKVFGYVQPAGGNANDKSLSKRRSEAVKAALKRLGVSAQITAVAKGRLAANSAKSRKAVVTVTGMPATK